MERGSPVRHFRDRHSTGLWRNVRDLGTVRVLMTQAPQVDGRTSVPRPGQVGSRAGQQPALALFAIGLIGMGVLALVYGDFAMGWQPVAPWFPARTALAHASGVLMVGCGVCLFFQATTAWALRILLPYLVLWQMLKIPALVVAPKLEAVYLGFGELAVLLAGGGRCLRVGKFARQVSRGKRRSGDSLRRDTTSLFGLFRSAFHTCSI